jgi:hypothetical protein
MVGSAALASTPEELVNGLVENENIIFSRVIFEVVGEYSDDVKQFGKR